MENLVGERANPPIPALARGAYGVRLGGMLASSALLPLVPPTWPLWRLSWDPAIPEVDHEVDRLPINVTGCLDIALSQAEAVIRTPGRPTRDALLHPWLSTVAAWATHHLGYGTFHAGGVIIDDRVWAFVGAKEAGKSTTMARLMQQGCALTSDDLVVLHNGLAYSGPGTLDLRASAATYLGVGTEQELVPGRRRWRLHFPPAPARMPFAGFVELHWGNAVEVRRLPGSQRIGRIVAARSVITKSGGETDILKLAKLPFLSFTRPKDYARLDESVSMLLSELCN